MFAKPVKLEGTIKLPSNKLINLEDQEQVKWKLRGQLRRRDVSFLLHRNIGAHLRGTNTGMYTNSFSELTKDVTRAWQAEMLFGGANSPTS